MYTTESPEVTAFLTAWHENGRRSFERWHDRLVYDTYAPKMAKDRRKYLALDVGGPSNASGCFLVDKQTGEVYTIKAYGKPNRKLGELTALTRAYEQATARNQDFGGVDYVGADAALAKAAQEVMP